jgi:hypothetical protein
MVAVFAFPHKIGEGAEEPGMGVPVEQQAFIGSDALVFNYFACNLAKGSIELFVPENCPDGGFGLHTLFLFAAKVTVFAAFGFFCRQE